MRTSEDGEKERESGGNKNKFVVPGILLEYLCFLLFYVVNYEMATGQPLISLRVKSPSRHESQFYKAHISTLYLSNPSNIHHEKIQFMPNYMNSRRILIGSHKVAY